jgi:hypothetical protein
MKSHVCKNHEKGTAPATIAWQPDIAGVRSRASRWGAIDDELNKSRTIWNCIREQIPLSLYEVSPD